MKEFFKKKKLEVIFTCVIIAIIIVLFLILYPIYGSAGNSNYGKRLQGIDEVKISDNDLKDLKEKLSEQENVSKATINIKGRIISVVIEANKEANKDSMLNLSSQILEFFDESQQKFYDIELFIKFESNDIGNIIGYKNKNSDSFIWTNNK